MSGANCSTEHYLICSKCKLNNMPPEKKNDPKPKARLNTSNLKDAEVQIKLAVNINTALSGLNLDDDINNQWDQLSKPLYV